MRSAGEKILNELLNEFPHLDPDVATLLEKNEDERIKSVREAKYIAYQKAETILDEIEWMYLNHSLERIGLLLRAESGNGKTTLLKVFEKRHPPHSTVESAIFPILRVESPEGPGCRRFLGAMLEALGFDDYMGATEEVRKFRVYQQLRNRHVRILMVDEVHNLLSGSPKQVEETRNLLKGFTNKLKIGLVLAGTYKAEEVIRSDTELFRRIQIYTLPVWNDGPAYRAFLSILERKIPLKGPSNLSSDEIATYLLQKSGGVLHDLVLLVQRAAEMAILDGSEQITLPLLKKMTFRSEGSSTLTLKPKLTR